jgi:hypothetical protein
MRNGCGERGNGPFASRLSIVFQFLSNGRRAAHCTHRALTRAATFSRARGPVARRAAQRASAIPRHIDQAGDAEWHGAARSTLRRTRAGLTERPRSGTFRAMKSTFVAALIASIASIALACSSSSSPKTQPCNENPWECPKGQTCWPMADSTFECLNSGVGTLGSACQDSVGVPTCSDGFACFATSSAGGACTPYCDSTDPSHACPTGLTCQTAELLTSSATEFHVCAGGTLIGGPPGGADSGTPAAGPDSGGGADGSPAGADSGAATGAQDGGGVAI